MDDPRYLARFAPGGNIGVLLGKASDGLCTVDLDSQTAAATFLALNPSLENTLCTSRVRGCNLWLRIRGEFPAAGKIKEQGSGHDIGEWRANGNQTVIAGEALDTSKGETQPTAYRIMHDSPPLETAFDEIQWPPEWVLPWEPNGDEVALLADQRLVAEHGAAFTVSQRGKVTINAMYFVARHALEHDVLYEPNEGSFYLYQSASGLWQPQTAAAVAMQFVEDLKRFADAQEPTDAKQIVTARTDRFLAGLVGMLRGHVEQREAFTREHGVVHVSNGMLHLDADPVWLRPFDPTYHSRNAAPVAYDLMAECPRFRRELLESALDPDDVSLVQRYAGALLLGRNLAQKILVLVGTAGGGKSTLLEIIERIIGLENIGQLRTELLGERFEIARFIGKTLLTGKDVEGRFLEAEGASKLKALVGHDLLDAERKGSNASFQVRGDFGVVITCNSRLRVKLDGDADAWRRRLLIVRYDRPKPERPERDFALHLLAQEGPGILRWMIEGALAHLAELADSGDYLLTERQRRRVDDLLAESDGVREFIRRRVENYEGADVTVSELEEAYSAFCEDLGWEPLPVRRLQTALPDAMQELRRAARRNGIERDGGAKRGFVNVRLIPAEEAATDAA